MKDDYISRTYKVFKKVTVANTGQVVELFNTATLEPGIIGANRKIAASNVFLKNLKATTFIKSLPVPPFPEFELTDTETQRLVKTLDIEWRAERYQLELMLSVDGGDWEDIGAVSILPAYRYPFRTHNLMDLSTDNLADELGSNCRVGVRMFDAGKGYLKENDIVKVHGSFSHEIKTVEKAPGAITSTNDKQWYITDESQILFQANPLRKQVTLVNAGQNHVYLSWSGQATPGAGIMLNPDGLGCYEYNFLNYPYHEEFSAVCESGRSTILVGMEAS